MPFITDTAMQKVATKLQGFETREEKRKIEVRQKLNEAKTVAESKLGRGARRVHARALRGRGRELFHSAHEHSGGFCDGAHGCGARVFRHVRAGGHGRAEFLERRAQRRDRDVLPQARTCREAGEQVLGGRAGADGPRDAQSSVDWMSVSVRNKTGAPSEFSAGVVGTVVQA